MNSKDIEKIFNILGSDVTLVTYMKDGYTIVIAPPVEKAAVTTPVVDTPIDPPEIRAILKLHEELGELDYLYLRNGYKNTERVDLWLRHRDPVRAEHYKQLSDLNAEQLVVCEALGISYK